MIEIHPDFQPRIKDEYPEGNKPIFEEWFFDRFDACIKTEREYLPVFWTSYYVNNRYCKDIQAMNMLQRMLDGLDRSKKYYTVLQYDDGIKNNVDHLDLKIFGSGGGTLHYPLPLLCQPHKFISCSDKTIFASFRGNIDNQIRKQMKQVLKYPKYRVTDERLSIHDYCKELSESLFALCPRGYGLSSFRIMEAIQQGAIPVYISDAFIFPHNTNFWDFGVCIESNDIDKIDYKLSSMSEIEIHRKQEQLKVAWNTFYDWQWNRLTIYRNAN